MSLRKNYDRREARNPAERPACRTSPLLRSFPSGIEEVEELVILLFGLARKGGVGAFFPLLELIR
jgi:hypothetical protein